MAYTQQDLDDAQAAYKALMLGQSLVQVVDQNGEKMTFVAADAHRLRSFIELLKSELGLLTPGLLSPMRVWF